MVKKIIQKVKLKRSGGIQVIKFQNLLYVYIEFAFLVSTWKRPWKSCLFCTKSVKIVCFSDPEVRENNILLLNSLWIFFHTSSMNPVIVIANEDFGIVVYLLRPNAYSNCGYYFWTCGVVELIAYLGTIRVTYSSSKVFVWTVKILTEFL